MQEFDIFIAVAMVTWSSKHYMYSGYSIMYLFTVFFKFPKCKKQFLVCIFLSKELHSSFIHISRTN